MPELEKKIPARTKSKKAETHIKIRFAIIGTINTAIGYGTFAILFITLGGHLHYTLISASSHIISTIIAFLTHRKFVFPSTAPILSSFFRFTISSCITLFGGLLLMGLLIEVCSIHPLPAQGAVTIATVVTSYLMHRHYSFKA